jgi:hypothetical protein
MKEMAFFVDLKDLRSFSNFVSMDDMLYIII